MRLLLCSLIAQPLGLSVTLLPSLFDEVVFLHEKIEASGQALVKPIIIRCTLTRNPAHRLQLPFGTMPYHHPTSYGAIAFAITSRQGIANISPDKDKDNYPCRSSRFQN
tara:strand:+ start:293 stop:619 length:327 start_codon:yes stop_codon:yes gene_type:complete